MKRDGFQFQTFSEKQVKVLTWWIKYPKKSGIIADGAIRSGKTISMSLSFILWAMRNYTGQNFALCGKTIGSLQRNVVSPLKQMVLSIGYDIRERRGDNLLIISDGQTENYFYLFGGKDESSQDLIQGITLAGAFFDEVALMPESFVLQATARCSVEGSKWFFNDNPEGPEHWFYKEWIQEKENKNLIYLHFDLDDNLTLSEDIKSRYRSMYSGVFYDRFILGQWVMAEGVIYDMFDKERNTAAYEDIKDGLIGEYYVSCDYGTQNATCFLLWRQHENRKWYCLKEYYYSGRDNMRQKTDDEYLHDMRDFLQGIVPKRIIVDPSAASFITALHKAGYPVKHANNDVLDGIRLVGTKLNTQEIVICRECRNTIREFGEYVWKPNAVPDTPIKENDHAMDALRYFVMTELNKVRLNRRFSGGF